ncbi:MAG: putative cytosol aminopeptidase [Actinomycetes bacterium]|nr:MAG: putative cytosol aminopeptidase [Actinomycetes bacterium]
MRLELSDGDPATSPADLVCIGACDGEELPAWLAGAPGAADARTGFKELAMLRPGVPARVLVVGLGRRGDLDPERARVAAALAAREAGRVGAASIAWAVPDHERQASIGAALTTGTILAGYRFDRFKRDDEDGPEARVGALTLLGAVDPEGRAETARVAAEAANRARDLQNLPANVADPAYLAARAGEIAEHGAVELEVLGPPELEREGMGGLLAVGAGSAKDPALIVLRYRGGGASRLGFVGKAVTFDTGGISLKPPASMPEMKMDMSGGAAVLEATAAVAELGLAVDLVSVLPTVENMPDGAAIRPGDVITQLNGLTVEVNNTDAEGRLILADALTWTARQGAERIVDVATLTGAVVVALGSTYAGLVANDDGWAGEVAAAGEAVGELAWRLPLHREYTEMTKGKIADLANAGSKRKAGPLFAAAFLEQFTEGVTWAHLDIAGTAWDVGREYVGKGASGFGTRLLVELARRHAARPAGRA